jgi:putative membrane protein
VILKNQFTPQSMWPYARFELALGATASIAAWLLVDRADVRWLALPATLATVLGTALSILLAVRVNTSYQRWWEASGIWAQITALSRNLARVVIAVGDSKRAAAQSNAAAITAFQRGMIGGQIAWVNALRLQLRGESNWASLAPHLSPATLILAFAFRIVERIGAVVEYPFANTTQDVPLTAICVTIERDLLEQLGDPKRPALPQPVNGYLF